jgi:tetratricopeptide (TPR) repeat protein
VGTKSGRIFFGLIFFLVAACPALAQEVGRIMSIVGTAEVLRQERWQSVSLDETLLPGDIVRTGPGSRVAVLLADGSQLKVNANSQLLLKQVASPTRRVAIRLMQSLLRLLSGEIWVRSLGEPLEIETVAAVATIRGTELNLAVEPVEAARLTVVEGVVEFRNPQGSVFVAAKEQAIAKPGEAPRKVVIIDPRDAVQWALYYPPLIDYRKVAYPEGPDTQTIRRALEAYQRGDLTKTLRTLEQVPPERRDARYFSLRAGLLLSVSRVAEARADIDEALRRHPSEATAQALRSIIALVQNQKEEALRLARQAVKLEPRSPVPQVALSYAYQAAFDLEKALDSIKQAVKLAPEDALIHARLAELELSRGELERALKAAQKAVALDPELARTHTVLGFAYLTQIKVAQAKVAFDKAIRLDPADPLPRMGLGLAKIRKGQLNEGRQDIEIAASLDPNNSLIRSYLSKAYYEEKRNPLAQDQFDMAKDLDPQDPTPYFYDAIRKQTENRPVEALRDLDKAIELNNNRAVYRSSLLLDQDLAARSSRLGYIYRDLGFEQRALVEGWQSLSTDQANYSAHRLLADAYSVLPLHTIARDSELLQSQLLQPININPVQPRLASDGLAFLDDIGPSNVGLNEYARLFSANGLRFHGDVLGGENGTLVDNVILTGIHDNISYSLGQFHSETNGYRLNNDDTLNIANAFIQAALSPKTSVLAEFRRTDEEMGDRFITFFDKDNFNPSSRTNLDGWSTRVGFRHTVSPSTTFLGTYIHKDEEANNSFNEGRFAIRENIDFAELRYMFQSSLFSITTGAGYLDGDIELFNSPPPEERSRIMRHVNGYVYGAFNYPQNLVVTLGVSVDSLQDTFINGKENSPTQVNPKAGFIWKPFKNTTVRGVAFRTLKRSLVSSQTIEPTQIAGFNQFFDGINGEDDRRYGIAIDQKVSSELYMGAEFSIRDLNVPDPDVNNIDVKQKFGRGYLHRILSDNWILSAQYQYERLTSNEFDLGEDIPPLLWLRESTTHRVPLELRFYHPSGFFARARTTYVDQEGEFLNLGQGRVLSGNDRFLLVDATLGYRLPKRLGVLSIEARNLFDERFNFQEFDLGLSDSTARDRVILSRFTLEF